MLHSGKFSKGPVVTQNVAAFLTLTQKLIERDPTAPGFGVFYGPSGYGKTFASIFAQNKTRAIRVEVGDCWTRKSLLKAILAECGQKAKGTMADMADEVIKILGDDPGRPLIIDEADRLVDKRMVELVRDLQDKTTAPIILIGEENLPTKLATIERAHNRVLDWVGAAPADMGDVHALAGSLCRGFTVADDLLGAILKASEGRARRIVVNLIRAGELARTYGLKEVDLAAWGDNGFFTSEAPKPRNIAAFVRGA